MTALGTGDRTAQRPEAPAEPATPPDDDDAAGSGPVLTLGEAGGVVLAVAVALIATASLALAQLGRHNGVLALALGLVATGALAWAMWRSGPRPTVRVDRVELALVGVTAVAGAVFFLPGFSYASVDKDPGLYVAHAFAIARHGDVVIPAPVLERGLDPMISQTGMFPGFWIEPDAPEAITPQFYHLYSATLATADDVGGRGGVFNVTPLLAVASVCLLAIAVRRAASTAAAVVFAALLVTSMMQVWQARYPSTEVLAQLLLAGALLGGVLAIERRWTGGALAAGVLLGTGFLCRPDGFLYIILAAAVVAAAIAVGRADRRLAALGVGLALTFPYAAWNAYEARSSYSASNSVPSLPVLLGACAALLAAGVALHGLAALVERRGAGGHPPDDGSGEPDPVVDLLRRWRVPLGVLASIGTGLVLLGLWHRETLVGTDYVFSHFQGETIRSLDEINIKWLSWFLTMRGLVLLWVGAVVVALTRVKAALYLLVLPAAVLLPLYLWDARISMRLMWWVRRFVPAVLPAVLLLIALAIAWALLHRVRLVRVLGVVAALALVAGYATQSWRLRGHDEMAGSWEAAEAVADFAGDEQGVFLYTQSDSDQDPIRNTPGAVWFIFDQTTSRLHEPYEIAEIDRYVEAFPDQPVFLVTGGDLPADLPPDRFTRLGTVTERLSMWKESQSEIPSEARLREDDLVVWRVQS
jgi:4-amino-4-deoxy-L-arabinose transferase-like glycosyltransferase